ncbi:unnamed protein product [Rhizophagus irregularis]|nr:unnamed protein product [Rhizophagus irregularis]
MMLVNTISEWIELADKTLVQEQVNTSNMQFHPQANTSIMQSHSQVYYTSHKLTEEYSVRKESTPGYDCAIED